MAIDYGIFKRLDDLENYAVAGDAGSARRFSPRAQFRGSPRPRVAMMLRCISDVPPAIVDETVLRYAVPCRPRIGAFPPRSCPYRPSSLTPVPAIRWVSSEAYSLVIDASWLGINPFACIVTTLYDISRAT